MKRCEWVPEADPAYVAYHDERANERRPERLQRRRVAVPEAPARPTDVPVREIVHEALESGDDVGRPIPFVGVRSLGYELLDAGKEPAVERLQLGCLAGLPVFRDLRVIREELD